MKSCCPTSIIIQIILTIKKTKLLRLSGVEKSLNKLPNVKMPLAMPLKSINLKVHFTLDQLS